MGNCGEPIFSRFKSLLTKEDLSTLVHMKSTDDTSEPVAEAENPLTPENMDDDDNKKSQTYSGKRLVKVGYIKYVSLVILTVQNAALGLSMRYARTRENVEMFSSAAAVVMAEVFKLLICIVLVMQESGNVKNGLRSMYATVILNVKDTLRVCVPSFLYIVQNNLLYVSASNLDAATYQDLSTLVHMKSTDDTSEPVAEAENPLTPENMDDDDNKKSQTYSGKRLVKVGYIKYVSLVILTVQNAALGLSMRYARTRENVEMFSSAAAVVMAEVFKLLICIVLVMQESGNVKNGLRSMYATVILNVKDTLRVCVPSFLYIVQNNLLYVSASNLDAATYQDLSTLVHMKSTDDTSEPVAEAENPLTPENMDDDDNKKSQTYSGKRLVKVGYIKYVSLVILTVQNAALGLSMRYARTRENVEMFSSAAAVVMAEVFKLLICIVLVMQESGNVKNGLRSMYATVILNVKDTLRVCVPSFLYIVQNNLLYVSASNLDAATYQVTYQLKILTTAFFAVVVLKRKLKKWQWLALGILAAGVALVQLSSTDKTSTKTSSELPEQSKVLGFSAALAACFISGFAGIYFEKVLKESDISVWMRNVQLSLLSLPFGTATYLFNGSIQDLLKGFDAFVWYLVLLQAAGGLIVAVVVKYADNILKGFATSVAIIISCVVSIYIFNFILTIQFAAGTTLVIASIFLYGYVPKKKPETRSSLSV